MNKKQHIFANTISVASLFVGVLLFTNSSFAQSPTRGEVREQKKESNQEKKEQIKEKQKNIIEKAKDVIKEKIKKQIKGNLVSIVGTTLTVKSNQSTFIVSTSDQTELKRKFGGDSTLSEFSANDQLLIIGNRKKNSDGALSSTEIEASYIRNMSIQRRFAVFNGQVTAMSGNTITIQTKGRGVQKVMVSQKTEYKEKNISITLANITVGDTLIVKGELWDRATDKIDAKIILKLISKKAPTITP